jgi:putative transposase
MSELKPVPAAVRLMIVQWPQSAPRGAVTRFCDEHQISRSVFYKILARSRQDGAWETIEPRSRRPASSPARTPPELAEQVLQVRQALEMSGFDHGPLSILDRMRDLGMSPPSRATIARILSRAGVVEAAPRKRPRSSFRRFVYPAPNCLWQLDAAEYPMAGGRTATIFQVIDDHSRLAVSSLAATGETAAGALQVVRTGIVRHGVPQRFLSDNGAALNPSRRGRVGQLVTYLKGLGVKPITGKPGKPTTQGKNERFHQTLFRFLDKQPQAKTLEELQQFLDTFDDYYNNERHHQALPGRMTPRQAWDATANADPPEPPEHDLPELPQHMHGEATRRVRSKGSTTVTGVEYMIGKDYAGTTIHAIWNPVTIEFFDHAGEHIFTRTRPPKGVHFVGNGKPRGFMANQPPSTKS